MGGEWSEDNLDSTFQVYLIDTLHILFLDKDHGLLLIITDYYEFVVS